MVSVIFCKNFLNFKILNTSECKYVYARAENSVKAALKWPNLIWPKTNFRRESAFSTNKNSSPRQIDDSWNVWIMNYVLDTVFMKV